MKEICPVCGDEEVLTTEHKIPQWFFRRLMNLGLSHTQIIKNSGLRLGDLKEKWCGKCNSIKNGTVDFSDKNVRIYFEEFIVLLSQKLDRKRKLFIKCECDLCDFPNEKVEIPVTELKTISEIKQEKRLERAHGMI